MDTEIVNILESAKVLARRYYALTGKPLGITGEMAECYACTLLGLDLATARQEGYDAIRHENGKDVKIQIKGRVFHPLDANPGQSIGRINTGKEWDVVALVLMDQTLDVYSIYEANRDKVTREIEKPGSKARNERGALSVESFKKIGRCVWFPSIHAENGELLAKLCLRSKRWFPLKDESGEFAFAIKRNNHDGFDDVSKAAAAARQNAQKEQEKAKKALIDELVCNDVPEEEKHRRWADIESMIDKALGEFKQGFASKEECGSLLRERGHKLGG